MRTAQEKSQYDLAGGRHDGRGQAPCRPGLVLLFLFLLFGPELGEAQENNELRRDAAQIPQDTGPDGQGAGLASRMNQRVANSLWQGRIQVMPETAQQARDRAELQKLIERINAVHIRQRKPDTSITGTGAKQTSPGGTLPGLPAETEPNELSGLQAAPPKTVVPRALESTEVSTGALSPAILQKLTKLPSLPDEVADPFGIAEILYKSGHQAEAARFYQSALKRVSPDDPAGSQKRAWILLQRAKCLRRQDPSQAIEMYQMLLREHPDSPWQESVQLWLKLAQWYSQERPAELIQECEQLKISANQVLQELDS